MKRFKTRQGGILVRLRSAEVAILMRLPSLVGSVGSAADDPAAARLAPEAYLDDEAASREFARLTGDDLARARREDAARFSEQLLEAGDGVLLSEEDAACWMRVIGDARLVLAARSGLDQVESLDTVASRDPEGTLIHLLGMFQGELSQALLAGMDA